MTRNRPDELRKAVVSVRDSRVPAHQLIVSDDSTDDRTAAMMRAEFPGDIHAQGPRRGIGANRNNALAHVTGSHVLFIDDDVLLDPDFLGTMAQRIEGLSDPSTTIVSGTEINHGTRVFPHRQNFLGFQAVDYRQGDRRYSVVINAAVFPAPLFGQIKFDESLVYGYEEIDFAARAVFLRSCSVQMHETAANAHYPSTVNRDYYAAFTEASRIYVTYKKYRWLESAGLKAALFLPVAYTHNLIHNLKSRRWAGFAVFARTARLSLSYIAACRRDPARYV